MIDDTLHGNTPSPDDSFLNAVGLCTAALEGDLDRVNQILDAQSDLINAHHPEQYRKAIHYAAREGHADIVGRLIEAGADPTEGIYPTREATTPWMLAKDRGHTETVDVIEKALKDRQKTTPVADQLCDAIRAGEQETVQRILAEHPAVVHETDVSENTPLHLAAYYGPKALIVDLLGRGSSLDAVNQDGMLPVHEAAAGQVGKEAVTLLLDHGAAYDLWTASAVGDAETVGRLLEEDPGRANGNHTRDINPHAIGFPLTIAAKNGHIEVVRLLLDHGADPDAYIATTTLTPEMPDGYPDAGFPLLYAIMNEYDDIAELLLDRGARADMPPMYAGPAIVDAALEGKNKKLADRIVMLGGRPLYYTLARLKNYLAIAEILDWADEDTPAAVKRRQFREGISHGPAERMLLAGLRWGDPIIVEMCLQHKIDLDDFEWFDFLWETPRMHGRIEGDHPAVLKRLLEYGIDPNIRGRGGETLLHRLPPLEHRSDGGLQVFAELLLDHGADINALDDEMLSTPLGLAARYGCDHLAAFLLERGADPHLSGAPWATPLAWAESRGHGDIAALLRKR